MLQGFISAPTWAAMTSRNCVDYQYFARGTGDLGRRFGRLPFPHDKDTKMDWDISKIG